MGGGGGISFIPWKSSLPVSSLSGGFKSFLTLSTILLPLSSLSLPSFTLLTALSNCLLRSAKITASSCVWSPSPIVSSVVLTAALDLSCLSSSKFFLRDALRALFFALLTTESDMELSSTDECRLSPVVTLFVMLMEEALEVEETDLVRVGEMKGQDSGGRFRAVDDTGSKTITSSANKIDCGFVLLYVRACMRACVRACVHACVRACEGVHG